MADEFDEIASPEFLLKAMEESGAKGAYRGGSEATRHLLDACQSLERQVKAQGHAAQVLERQEMALKQASAALSWAMMYQIAAVIVGGSILLAGAGVAWHFIGKEPREVLYGCTKWEGERCLRWLNLDSLRSK